MRSSAFLRNATTTPDTVKIRPNTRWVRLIKPIIEENSPTCTRPIKVERVRMRGLPVTAPRRGLSSIGATM